ncbi:MAG: hypothetical protein ABI678_10655 [Kofleriaceae bacterium]
MAQATRLPLVSGRTSWEDRVRFNAALVPILVIACVVFAVWVPAFDGLSDLPLIGGLFALLQFTPVIAVFALIGVAMKSREHALANRPADLVISGDQIEIVGGTHHGLVLDADEVGSLHLVERDRADRGFVEGLREVFSDRKSSEHCVELRTSLRLLAEAVSPDEQRTVRAVHQMLSAPPALREATGKVVEELTCASCGAPVPPDDRAEVACAACQAPVEVPDALRERVRVGRVATHATALRKRAVTAMTTLPGARGVGWQLRALGWVMLAAWPGLFVGAWIAAVPFSFGLVVGLLVIGVALDVAIYYAVLPRFVVRQAFPISLYQFAARSNDQDQACCRQCSAPLPISTDTVVRCAFCDTDNLLGRELVRALPALATEAGALEPAALAWRDDRRRTRIASALATLLLIGSTVTAVLVLPGMRTRALLARCEWGEPSACKRLGTVRGRAILDDQCYGASANRVACMALDTFETGVAERLRASHRLCELYADHECAAAKLICGIHYDDPACASSVR